MPLKIETFVLGPLDNNSYMVADTNSGEAVVFDPSFDSGGILLAARKAGYQITAIWMTHAHFDHLAGVDELVRAFEPPLPVGLHPADLNLWRQRGNASMMGVRIETPPDPTVYFKHGQVLHIGQGQVEVRHVPGHTAGHVIFYLPEEQAAIVGDVIFAGSIGRTDLPGGNYDTLLNSIREQILTLPPETRLLNGHGPETTVEEEIRSNPFLQ